MAIRDPLARCSSGRASAWLDSVIVSLAPCSIRCELFFHAAPRRKVTRSGRRRDWAKVQEKYRSTRAGRGERLSLVGQTVCRWRQLKQRLSS